MALEALLDFIPVGITQATSFALENESKFQGIFQGFKGYALARSVDRIARWSFLGGNETPIRNTLTQLLRSAISEELIYSVILPSHTLYALPLRLIASFAVSSSATRAITGKPLTNDQGLTTDSKVGLVWAIAHEVILQAVPPEVSKPILGLSYMITFALGEVCPPNDGPAPPVKYSAAWTYKVVSACFFRMIAINMREQSPIAPFMQHTFFNLHTQILNHFFT